MTPDEPLDPKVAEAKRKYDAGAEALERLIGYYGPKAPKWRIQIDERTYVILKVKGDSVPPCEAMRIAALAVLTQFTAVPPEEKKP